MCVYIVYVCIHIYMLCGRNTWVSIIIKIPYLKKHHELLLTIQDLFSLMLNILKIKTLTFFVLKNSAVKRSLTSMVNNFYLQEKKPFEILLGDLLVYLYVFLKTENNVQGIIVASI